MAQRIGIVGGGILGLAVGREITNRWPGVQVIVFEKEDRVAAHQTGHNSGVVHAGIYYKPGSLKAELCTRGRTLLREYCAERALPYVECGKLVVAVGSEELGRVDTLEKTAGENGVPGLRRLEGDEIRELEPHAAGLVALHSPHTAITDFVAIARSYAADIEAAGGSVLLSTRVTEIVQRTGSIELATEGGRHRVDRLVLCAGLQSDRVGTLVGDLPSPRIVPFRGEYMAVLPSKRDFVNGLIYPVPDPRYPFLGVHYTRRVDGGLDVGPNAILALHREGYRRSAVGLADVGGILAWPGFWLMAREHWRTGAYELRGSLFKQAYMRAAQRYVPDIGVADVVRGSVGVRAQAVERNGALVDDFRINHAGGVTSVRNAPSPAATSSLAIAEFIVDRMAEDAAS